MCNKTHITLIGAGKKWVFYGINSLSHHSEIVALKKLIPAKINKDIVLVNLRISKTNKFGLSRPCSHCASFIKRKINNCRIRKIVYSIGDNVFESTDSNNFMLDRFDFITSGNRPRSIDKTLRRRR